MKKNALKKISILMMALAGFLFIFPACSDDDDPEPTPGDKTTSVKFNFDANEDMAAIFDFTATYRDTSNTEVTDTIASLPWEKEIKDIPLPYTAELKIACTAKKGFVADKDSFDLASSYSFFCPELATAGTNDSTSFTVKKDSLDAFINVETEQPLVDISEEVK